MKNYCHFCKKEFHKGNHVIRARAKIKLKGSPEVIIHPECVDDYFKKHNFPPLKKVLENKEKGLPLDTK